MKSEPGNCPFCGNCCEPTEVWTCLHCGVVYYPAPSHAVKVCTAAGPLPPVTFNNQTAAAGFAKAAATATGFVKATVTHIASGTLVYLEGAPVWSPK